MQKYHGVIHTDPRCVPRNITVTSKHTMPCTDWIHMYLDTCTEHMKSWIRPWHPMHSITLAHKSIYWFYYTIQIHMYQWRNTMSC